MGALIRKFLPEVRVVTAGIEARDAMSIPTITSEVCQQWGLGQFDRISKSLDSIESLSEFDCIIAADSFVFNRIDESNSYKSLLLLTDLSNEAYLQPIDPTGLSSTDFKFEIAKACLLTMRWIHSQESTTPALPDGYLYKSQINSEDISTLLGVDPDKTLVLLDTQVLYPNPEAWRVHGVETIFYNPRVQLDANSLTRYVKPHVLISKFELDRPETFYLSAIWWEINRKLAQSRGNAKLCAQLDQYPSDMKYLAILSLIHTRDIHVLTGFA